MQQKIIISLGGSLITPEEIDVDFLKGFITIIKKYTDKYTFVIITGGGKISRKYTTVTESITTPSKEDLDWIGIAATRLNAEFLRVLFAEDAYEKIILDPNNIPVTDKPIIFGGGWKPGNSSDLAAVVSAISVGAKRVINLSNIDFAYDKDPNKFHDAKKIENISWAEYRKLIPEDWVPGLSSPFDPIASKIAEENSIEVDILNGKNFSNFEKCLEGSIFSGTKIK